MELGSIGREEAREVAGCASRGQKGKPSKIPFLLPRVKRKAEGKGRDWPYLADDHERGRGEATEGRNRGIGLGII